VRDDYISWRLNHIVRLVAMSFVMVDNLEAKASFVTKSTCLASMQVHQQVVPLVEHRATQPKQSVA
jgi:hypothetical protein